MAVETARQPRQRWHIVFTRREPALSLREDEVVASFETAFTEAALPLSRTSATRPRARLSLAASLPVGVDAQGEVLEAYFDDLIAEDRLRAAGELLPAGLRIIEARDVWQGFRSAASRLRAVEYEVDVSSAQPLAETELRDAVRNVLAARTLPGRRRRGQTERRADAGERDLRPLIEHVEVLSVDETAKEATLLMRLRSDRTGSGRPEDVLTAMGPNLRALAVRRRPLTFVDTPPARR